MDRLLTVTFVQKYYLPISSETCRLTRRTKKNIYIKEQANTRTYDAFDCHFVHRFFSAFSYNCIVVTMCSIVQEKKETFTKMINSISFDVKSILRVHVKKITKSSDKQYESMRNDEGYLNGCSVYQRVISTE